MESGEPEICSVCFNKPETNTITISEKESVETFNNWFNYLHTAINNSIQEHQTEGEAELTFCKSCYESAVHLIQLSQDLILFQKKISDLTLEFSLSVLHRRSQSSGGENKQRMLNYHKSGEKLIQFDASGLPPQLFSALPSFQQNTVDESVENDEDNEDEKLFDSKEEAKYQLNDEGIFEVVEEDYTQNPSDNLVIEYENTSIDLEVLDEDSGENIDYGVPPILDCYEYENHQAVSSPDREKEIYDEASNSNEGNIHFTNDDLKQYVSLPTIQVERMENLTSRRKTKLSLSTPTYTRINSKLMTKYSVTSKKSNIQEIPSTQQPNMTSLARMKALNLKQAASKKSRSAPLSSSNFQCQYCGKYCKSKADLVIHVRIHTGEKPFKCNVCQKAFTQPQHLNYHKSTHTGERNYSCLFCDKKFVGTSARDAHQRLHTGVRPYKCDYCDRRFNESGNRNRHMRVHTGS